MKIIKLLALAAALFAVYGFAGRSPAVPDGASAGVGRDKNKPAAVDRKVDGVSSASRKKRKRPRRNAPAEVQSQAGA